MDDLKVEKESPQQILVLPLSGGDGEPVGLLPEQKVLEMEGKKQVDVIPICVKDQNLEEPGAEQRGEGQEKRTRLLLFWDKFKINTKI